MNRIFIFIIILFSYNNLIAQKYNSDKFQMRLNGKIKKITQVNSRCPMINSGNDFFCTKDTITYNFDKKGNLKKIITFSTDSLSRVKEKGVIIITEYMKDENRKLKKAYIKNYNKKNQLTKITLNYIHSEIEKPLEQWEYFYDRNKIKTKEVKTKWWNGRETSTIYFYNKKGDVEIEQVLINKKLESTQSFDYKYELDRKANWTHKIKIGGIYNETENRIIEYY